MLVNGGKAFFGCYFVQYKLTIKIYDNRTFKVHCNLHTFNMSLNNMEIICMGT